MSVTVIYSNFGDTDTELLRGIWQNIPDVHLVEIRQGDEDYEHVVDAAIETEDDTINIENYITKHGRVCESMRDFDDENFRLYIAFCEEAEKNDTLPDIVKEEDPEFLEIFNVMDESDFVDYVEKRLGKKNMSYEQETITIRWN